MFHLNTNKNEHGENSKGHQRLGTPASLLPQSLWRLYLLSAALVLIQINFRMRLLGVLMLVL